MGKGSKEIFENFVFINRGDLGVIQSDFGKVVLDGFLLNGLKDKKLRNSFVWVFRGFYFVFDRGS